MDPTERVTVATTVNGKLIYVRYQPVLWQKFLLTSAIAFELLVVVAGFYFMVAFRGMVPAGLAMVFTSVMIFFPTFRAASWIFFGVERIEINENRIIIDRYSLVKHGTPSAVDLDENTSLYVNFANTWSWRTLKETGIFRVSNGSQKVNLGIRIGEGDFETILKLLNSAIRTYRPLVLEHPADGEETTETAPPLDQQLGGKLEETVQAYFNRYTPEVKVVEPVHAKEQN